MKRQRTPADMATNLIMTIIGFLIVKQVLAHHGFSGWEALALCFGLEVFVWKWTWPWRSEPNHRDHVKGSQNG